MEINRPGDLGDIASLGLTLAEAKRLLARVQQEIVAAQAREHAVRRPDCSRCGGVCRVKDYRDHAVATLFGEVTVRLAQFRCAACGGIEAGVGWPSHCRSTPGLDRLQAHLCAVMTYRTAAGLLEQLFPVDAGKHHETMRCHALKVGEALGRCATIKAEPPASAVVVTLDSRGSMPGPIKDELSSRVALITGAAGGIGSGAARYLAGSGAAVVICDVQAVAGEAIAQSIRDEGGSAEFNELDVGSEDGWRDAAASATKRFGKIDILVNNAGVYDRKPLMETSPEAWERTLRINLTGAFLGMRAVVPQMRERGGGVIVNVSSTSALVGDPDAPYSASKWGLRGLTRTATLEFADWGIRVNSVHPGSVPTALHDNAPSGACRSMAQAQPDAPRRTGGRDRRGGPFPRERSVVIHDRI